MPGSAVLLYTSMMTRVLALYSEMSVLRAVYQDDVHAAMMRWCVYSLTCCLYTSYDMIYRGNICVLVYSTWYDRTGNAVRPYTSLPTTCNAHPPTTPARLGWFLFAYTFHQRTQVDDSNCEYHGSRVSNITSKIATATRVQQYRTPITKLSSKKLRPRLTAK